MDEAVNVCASGMAVRCVDHRNAASVVQNCVMVCSFAVGLTAVAREKSAAVAASAADTDADPIPLPARFVAAFHKTAAAVLFVRVAAARFVQTGRGAETLPVDAATIRFPFDFVYD